MELPHVPLKGESRHHVILCVKEALNNIVKHADASKVRFGLAVAKNILIVTIAENRSGFDTKGTAGIWQRIR
ncbi:MAG: hypothetical protein M2R45_01322 [Verrucomicrobia subdivision 3 bacterium]|nr:hypothetical protein [Limisphaerales bacterium]MCS1415188.1 hypothetical protein [Limisphaerales bacterium]